MLSVAHLIDAIFMTFLLATCHPPSHGLSLKNGSGEDPVSSQCKGPYCRTIKLSRSWWKEEVPELPSHHTNFGTPGLVSNLPCHASSSSGRHRAIAPPAGAVSIHVKLRMPGPTNGACVWPASEGPPPPRVFSQRTNLDTAGKKRDGRDMAYPVTAARCSSLSKEEP